MRSFYLPLLAMLIVVAGCDKDSGSIDAREEKDPNVVSGQEYMAEGKYDEAIATLKKAIDSDPDMARPHLDLAVIYQQYKINYIHAIYHYDRYLELRPDAEKAGFIQEQKLKVAQALANTLINNSPEVKKVVQERSQLIQENNDLKRQLAAALKSPASTASAEPAPTVTSTVPKTAKPTSEPVKTASNEKYEIYHVVSGDTLTKIATKFYGDSARWDIIYDANKDTLRSPSDLKVGQTIVIPKIN